MNNASSHLAEYSYFKEQSEKENVIISRFIEFLEKWKTVFSLMNSVKYKRVDELAVFMSSKEFFEEIDD